MYSHILVATDGSDPADGAVEHAIALAASVGATVHVLHVIEMIPIYTRAAGPAVLGQDADVEDRERDARALLEEVSARADETGVKTEHHIKRGNVYRQVVDTAADVGVDLIVLGSQGRNSIGDVFLGSTAEKVVRIADVPVLTVRARS